MRCKQSVNHDWSPTRLIWIGPPQDALRIIETKEQCIDGPYMTLSHRWGQRRLALLTRDALRAIKQGFDASILPASFQDAICVLQDSVDDFQAEAAIMHQVYGNSYLKLSAKGAVDNYERLFATRRPDSLLPVTVQAAWKDQADTYYLFHEKIWKQNVLNAQSINEGGFSRKDICHPKSCTLARNRSSSKSGQLARVTRQASQECSACNWEQKSLSSSFFGKAEQARKRYTRYAWIHVLRRYVHCALTNTGEIFIALAGLASRVNDTLKDVYLAGLWRSVIFADLLCKGRHEHCG